MGIKKVIAAGILLTSAIVFSACSSTDVVGKTAKASFNELVSKKPDYVKKDSSSERFFFKAASGDRFEWSKDFSKDSIDIAITLDAKPFLEAGLDVSKLNSEKFIFNRDANTILMPFELSSDKFSYNGEASPSKSFEQVIDKNRKLIGYHQKLDHYGISLPDGNKFEWAKNISTNDKDIVFVLNPKPFIEAGVNPDKIQGIVFTQVEESMDKPESKIDVFLKPFNLDV